MKCRTLLALVPLAVLAPAVPLAQEEWKPAEGPLSTRWTETVSPAMAHAEYPRPQMVRREWENLNGLWNFAVTGREDPRPTEAEGEILVPFPIESALSGVMRRVTPQERVWYWRDFKTQKMWGGQRVLLHFGAVDWEAEVWVDGGKVGSHRGGFDPFTFDVTDFLAAGGEHEIVVAAWDPTDAGTQPRGKQVREPGGIWYTPSTGIWRTVWLEPVSPTHIEKLEIVPELAAGRIRLFLGVAGLEEGAVLQAVATDRSGLHVVEEFEVKRRWNQIYLDIPDARAWSPDDPFLYDLTLRVKQWDMVVDEITSYFGMREISLAADEKGVQRLFLNGEPLFHYGPLDQGYWPDGLYTAPSDEALRHDLEVTKQLGFNAVRKHVKIEPDRWYYWCDKIGLLVWQDMPSGDRYIGGNDPDIERTPESAEQFQLELERNIGALFNHPSIVMWVPYNEGWGQWETAKITEKIRFLDETRLVNSVSGWTDRGTGDVLDIHSYPGPAIPPLEKERAVVLGEFGGLGLPLDGHTWQAKKNWGYRSFDTPEALTTAYVELIDQLRPMIADGLAAAIYTQTTDVEIEVNGLMSYDREVIKLDAERVAAANARLWLPPPIVTPILPSSRETPQLWHYTTTEPADDWYRPGFDTSAWAEGPGGFGTEETPGAVIGTCWDGTDIWLRREIELAGDFDPAALQLRIHHDEDTEIYLNGEPIAERSGYTTSYVLIPLDERICRVLRPGESNTLAIHCRQTGGGQFIDLGLVEVREVEAAATQKKR
jgi:hypothetical protein